MVQQRTHTAKIIGLAIEVHRNVGPGLLESVYAECMAFEPSHAGTSFETQITVPVVYEGMTIPMGFRADAVVENAIIPEIKTVAALFPLMTASFSPTFV